MFIRRHRRRRKHYECRRRYCEANHQRAETTARRLYRRPLEIPGTSRSAEIRESLNQSIARQFSITFIVQEGFAQRNVEARGSPLLDRRGGRDIKKCCAASARSGRGGGYI